MGNSVIPAQGIGVFMSSGANQRTFERSGKRQLLERKPLLKMLLLTGAIVVGALSAHTQEAGIVVPVAVEADISTPTAGVAYSPHKPVKLSKAEKDLFK